MCCANTADRTPVGASPYAGLLVVGLGNPILGDDGVGWRVAQEVASAAPGLEVDCVSLGGLSLMERLIGYEAVILVDALRTRGGLPGVVTRFPLEHLPARAATHTAAAHDTSLPTALNLGRSLGANLPDRIEVVAVEAERVYDFSEALTPAVAAAVPRAAQLVLELVAELAGHAPAGVSRPAHPQGITDDLH